MLGTGYFLKSQKLIISKKNQSVLIAKISSRKTQKIVNPQKFLSTQYPLEKCSVVWSARARSLFLVAYLRCVSSGLLDYRIYSINRPGRLLNFWTLKVGAYSRWALIRGLVLIKFSPFSASVVCLFCNNTINGNNKTRRCNKARFL